VQHPSGATRNDVQPIRELESVRQNAPVSFGRPQPPEDRRTSRRAPPLTSANRPPSPGPHRRSRPRAAAADAPWWRWSPATTHSCRPCARW